MGEKFEKQDCYRLDRSHFGNGRLIPFEGMLITAMHSVQGAPACTARKTATRFESILTETEKKAPDLTGIRHTRDALAA